MMKSRASTLVLLATAVLQLSCSSAAVSDESVAETSSAVMCGGDNRSAVASLTYPRGAVGKLNVGCTGTIIAPNKVLTAAHCIGDTPPSSITFSPQFGIVTPGAGPAASTVTRITQGRDAPDHPQYGDWAILTFANNFQTQLGANYQQMYRVIPTFTPFSTTLIGYHGDLFSIRPGLENCTVTAFANWDGKTLLHNCDVIGGASGGPHYVMSGGLAQLRGVQSGHGFSDCVGQNGNNAANGEYFSFAPDNAVGTAIAYNADGRMRVFSSDMDWTLIAYRDKTTTDPSSAWTAWRAFDSGFTSSGRRMAAVNLEDNRQEVWVVKPSGELVTRWDNGGGAWSSWVSHGTPTTVKDVVATGGNGVRSHLFVLGTNNVVYVAYKTGASNSLWSSWASLGTVSGANALSAVYFSSVHQVFVVSNAGSWTAWGSQSGFTPLQSFGGSGFSSVGAGTLQDGRVSVFAFGSGSLQMRIRAANGSSWSSWSTAGLPLLPANVTSFGSLSARVITGGPEQVVAVGNNGNIYTTWESSAGAFVPWVRFYL